MATIEQHISALMGDQLLTIARQAAEIDALTAENAALRERLAGLAAAPGARPEFPPNREIREGDAA